MLNFYPAPGICLVEPLDDTSGSLTITQNKGRIGQGKVIACGEPVVTDFGATVPCPVKTGDLVYFLTYENQYDESIIEGKHYVWALFRDIRGIKK